MPNYCNYEMKIKGSKKAINRVLSCLKADYNYTEGKPSHKHFFRVFGAYEDSMERNEDGTYTLFVYGDCAWSIYSCMCSGEYTYYNSLKESHHDIFMGTTLLEQSKNCEIEVFSEEEGCGFSEHYIYRNGECLCDTSVEIQTGGYTKTGKPTKKINWDTYDGEIVVFNPNREGVNEPYRWTI